MSTVLTKPPCQKTALPTKISNPQLHTLSLTDKWLAKPEIWFHETKNCAI